MSRSNRVFLLFGMKYEWVKINGRLSLQQVGPTWWDMEAAFQQAMKNKEVNRSLIEANWPAPAAPLPKAQLHLYVGEGKAKSDWAAIDRDNDN